MNLAKEKTLYYYNVFGFGGEKYKKVHLRLTVFLDSP